VPAKQGLREAVEAHYGEGKSRRNIVLHQAKLGQVVAQNLVGLLQRSKVERSSRISWLISQHERDGKSADRSGDLHGLRRHFRDGGGAM